MKRSNFLLLLILLFIFIIPVRGQLFVERICFEEKAIVIDGDLVEENDWEKDLNCIVIDHSNEYVKVEKYRKIRLLKIKELPHCQLYVMMDIDGMIYYLERYYDEAIFYSEKPNRKVFYYRNMNENYSHGIFLSNPR